MKKIHIILLILIIGALAGMSFFIKDLTTYETFSSAQEKTNKFVVVKVKLDKNTPVEYDQVKNPNLTTFYAVDHDGKKSKVVYKNANEMPFKVQRQYAASRKEFICDIEPTINTNC